MKMTKLFDASPSNIFRRIGRHLSADWWTDDFADNLNIEYFLGHSGNKETSLLVDRLILADDLLVDDGGHVIVDEFGDPVMGDVSGGTYEETLAKLIVMNFGNKWKSFMATLIAEYSPVQESKETTISTPRVSQVSESNSGSQLKTTTENKGTETAVQGFNSTEYTPSDRTTGTTDSESVGDFDRNHTKTTISQDGNNTTETTRTGGDYADRVADYRGIMEMNMIERIIHDVDMILTLPYYPDN